MEMRRDPAYYVHLAALSNITDHGIHDMGRYFSDNYTHSMEIEITPERRGIGGPIVMIIVIILLAVIGNTVMICAVLRLAYLRTVTNLFTINLAISDLGIALLIMPMWIISLAMGKANRPSPFPTTLCEATAFMTVLLLLVSTATLSGISLDRYFSICHPMHYPQQVTPNRIYCVIVYIWMQSILLSIAPLIGWGKYLFRPQTISICNPQWSNTSGFSIFLLFMGMIFPCSAMLFSYTRIIQEARKQAKRIENIQLILIVPQGCKSNEFPAHAPDTSRRSSLMARIKSMSLMHKYKSYTTFNRNLKTLKTVFIIMGAFIICWGPYVLLNIWSVINSTKPIPYSADLITTLLVVGNSAVNPFVFIFLTRDLRWAVRMILVRCLDRISKKDDITSVGSRIFSRQPGSMADTARVKDRASFDSGVEVDRDQFVSPRLSVTSGTPIPRALSTITFRCDSIDSDEEDAEREHTSVISGAQTWPGATLDIPDTQTHNLQEGDIFSCSHANRNVFVPQFGPTLKPPDPLRLFRDRAHHRCQFETQHTEKDKLCTASQGYGTIGSGSAHEQNKCPLTRDQHDEARSTMSSFDQRIPILVLPDDDSG